MQLLLMVPLQFSICLVDNPTSSFAVIKYNAYVKKGRIKEKKKTLANKISKINAMLQFPYLKIFPAKKALVVHQTRCGSESEISHNRAYALSIIKTFSFNGHIF